MAICPTSLAHEIDISDGYKEPEEKLDELSSGSHSYQGVLSGQDAINTLARVHKNGQSLTIH
jgi:hypothetical protein